MNPKRLPLMAKYQFIILHLLFVSYVTVPAGVREPLECDCIVGGQN